MNIIVDEKYKLILGDCVENMKSIEDNTVDLILTDPPYNLGLFMENRDTNLGALRNNHFVASNWDHIQQPEWEINMSNFFKEATRILKKRGSLVTFMSIIKAETIIRIAQENNFYYKTTGIWHKTNPMPRNMNLHFVNSTEAWIYFVNNGKTGIFNNNGKLIHDFFETSVINNGEKKFGNHPTQKPVLILEHFVNLLTDEGAVVLDPFMGSGSTGVAALNRNRKFYGIELDEKYFKLATKRLEHSALIKRSTLL